MSGDLTDPRNLVTSTPITETLSLVLRTPMFVLSKRHQLWLEEAERLAPSKERPSHWLPYLSDLNTLIEEGFIGMEERDGRRWYYHITSDPNLAKFSPLYEYVVVILKQAHPSLGTPEQGFAFCVKERLRKTAAQKKSDVLSVVKGLGLRPSSVWSTTTALTPPTGTKVFDFSTL